jgi:hypothetical protein
MRLVAGIVVAIVAVAAPACGGSDLPEPTHPAESPAVVGGDPVDTPEPGGDSGTQPTATTAASDGDASELPEPSATPTVTAEASTDETSELPEPSATPTVSAEATVEATETPEP